ncbi:MAG: helix-turn-helix domain-containing protein [Candidatus Limnocylindria bacterium]
MAMSTIILLNDHPRTPLPIAVGRELRRRRTALGLSQAAVATPFTRALVCAVEHGRSLPSLTALAVFLEHLDVPLHEFFEGVHSQMTGEYNLGHGDREAPPSRRRR